jgi:hypothetical protein
MQNSNLPTQSGIYKPRNIQYEQSFIQMNIYKPPPKNNDSNITQSNENVNQTDESLVKNNNQLSLEDIRDNSNNYPLTENRIKSVQSDAIIVEKTTVFYKSVNPNMNYPYKGNIVQNNVNNMAYQQNVGVVGVVQNQPPIQVQNCYNEKEEKSSCEDIVCCILLVIYYLYCFIFIILFYIIACVLGIETEDSCFYCCIHGLCFKRKKRNRNKCIIY